MKKTHLVILILATALGACAFVPKTNLRLEEARRAHQEARTDLQVAAYARGELQSAEEALERAQAASSTLDDPAVVDHLAYVAKQRFAIARATVRRAAAELELRRHSQSTSASLR